ncbi:MAG: glutathione S-transferase family protein [Spirochaetes bacterium]|nr:glutathione S-transferase family protein [Spirochaetota bacterium]
MIRLHGFPISNYYNRIQMALRIKGLAYEEVRAAPSRDADYLAINPLGVIPTLEIDGVFLAETHPTLEYLDEVYGETTRLMPQNALERHRVRQIVNYIDIHIDKPLRLLRDFQSKYLVDIEPFKELVRLETVRAIDGLNRIVKFSPYIAGNEISLADCAAYTTLPWFAELALRYLGDNLLAALKGFDEYKNFLDQNPDFLALHTNALKQMRVMERAKRLAAR